MVVGVLTCACLHIVSDLKAALAGSIVTVDALLHTIYDLKATQMCNVVQFGNDIGIMVRVYANDPGDLGSIPGRVIPKTQKMVLDATMLNTQHFKVRIKSKVEQSRERSSALLYTLVQ